MTTQRKRRAHRRQRLTVARVLSPIAGAGILYHEIWLVQQSELLLVLVGLWLIGAPIAQFVDILNKAGKFAEQLDQYHDEAAEFKDEIDKATGG